MSRAVRVGAAALCLAQLATGMSAAAQDLPPIGVIDFFGLNRQRASELQRQVAIRVGDQVPLDDDGPPASFTLTEKQLSAMPGIESAKVSGLVCCDQGRLIIYIGIRESGARTLRFREAPRGAARLPAPVVIAAGEFSAALWSATERGITGEDESSGHTFSDDPALHAVQLRFVALAREFLPQVRAVLREGADATERASAALVVGYAEDEASVVPDLVRAMSDPSHEVRNNAMRALLVFTKITPPDGGRAPPVPFAPFIDLLGSREWSDRNKASAALDSLTVARNPKLLAALRKRALVPLSEMAFWKIRGHAEFGFRILGRIGGLTDAAIADAWQRDDRGAVVRAARNGPSSAAAGAR